MKQFVAAALMFSAPLAGAADLTAYEAEARQITAEFFAELKGELVKGMQAGGPVAAIEVCNTLAPAIAAKHSQQSGWDVGRTSLKLRNPNDAPDAWEVRVLQDFEQRRAAGDGPDALVASEVVEEDGKTYYRFMQGIVMPPLEKMPCLKCHGERIDPATAARLDQLYPQDQARGYKAGQVRGAFTLKKPL